MKKVVIVEDETIISLNLRILLEQNAYEVVKCFDNAESALPFILQNDIDIALFDIELKGEKDGIWLAERLAIKNCIPFIFITSFFDKKTLEKANKLKPAAYIVKPFQEDNLLANIELALKKTKVDSNHNLGSSANNKIFVKDKHELIAINKSEIKFLEAYDNYTYVHTIQNNKILISHTLKSMEAKLGNSGFIRIHRSFMVNFQSITHIQEGYVFIGQQKISVGKSYRSNLMDFITVI